jgi:light-regulated signal transduction histidine kinase (bacteriophytochrome)
LYISMVVPVWIFLDTICIGGDFSQSAAFLAIIALIYILYEEQLVLRRWLVSIVLVLFTVSTLFAKYRGSIFAATDQPFDELLVMYVSVIWIFTIFGRRDREKQRLFRDLENKNKSLLIATQELERFTNIASHDLKSPLRNISSFIGLIERDLKRGNSERLLDNLDYAKKGAQQMHHLIQGILEVSSVNQNVFVTKGMFDLGELMQNAIDNLRLEIAEKNAIVNHGPLPSYLCCDVEMTLLFQNLIQNGIKYNTSPQPIINITFEETREQLKITFADNGIGIEPQYHSYVFEHFKRLHSASEYMGTGLGLSLCQKIAQKHKGEIQLVSEIGKGSQFVLVLPVIPE